MTWSSYPREPVHPVGRPVIRPGTSSPGAALGGLGLGNHFDDASWRGVLQRRGWTPTTVRDLPGWVSPQVGATRLLFCAPELGTGGLDDTPFLIGFRRQTSDVDEVWRVVPHGDGELVFDHLAHAGSGFDPDVFLRWVSHESMADATPL